MTVGFFVSESWQNATPIIPEDKRNTKHLDATALQKDLLYLLKDENIKITFEAEKSNKTTDIETDEVARAPHSTEELYYYHPDHLGTATFLTDHLGIPYQFFLNLPFGESMAEQRSYTGNFNNRWKFNGKELDEETGLYYYGARFYNPSTSLWLSVDPLVEKTMDAYGYCYQNPIMLIDPTGMSPEDGENNKPPRGSGLRGFFNSIFFPNRKQTNDGYLEVTGTKSGRSAATGWDLTKKPKKDINTDTNNDSTQKSSRPLEQSVAIIRIDTSSDPFGQLPSIINMTTSTTTQNPNAGVTSVTIGGRTQRISQSTTINFYNGGFTVAHNFNGSPTGGINRALPLNNSQQRDLQSIATYLNANPNATIGFQYPNIDTSFASIAQSDLRTAHGLRHRQITNFLVGRGVDGRRIRMNYGTGLRTTIRP